MANLSRCFEQIGDKSFRSLEFGKKHSKHWHTHTGVGQMAELHHDLDI